jgi:hypothetical protein
MFQFDATVAAAIFFSSFFLDLISARYTYYLVSLHAGRAATLSFIWHLLSAVVVVEYAHNAFYVVFVCLGGGLGTYFTIWNTRRAEASRLRAARPDSRRGTARRCAASSLRARQGAAAGRSQGRVSAAPKAPW